jgi:hypothetical protein
MSKESKKPTSKGQARESAEETSHAKRSICSIEDVPILRYGNKNNYHKFKEDLLSYLSREYGMVSKFIETDELYIPPVPKRPRLPPNVTASMKKTFMMMHAEDVKLYVRRLTENQEKLCLIYADILGNLSQESKEKVKEAPDWEVIKDKRDPLRLWRRITHTHINGESLMGNLNIYQAQQIYNRLRMNSKQTVHQFKEEFDEAVIGLQAAAAPIPSDLQQATDFLFKLDARYAQLRVSIENNNNRGVEQFPTTLTAMYRIAAQFKVVTDTGGVMNATAYVITTKKKAKSTRRETAPADKKPYPDADSSASKPKPKKPKQRTRPCKHCGGEHWDNECDRKESAVASSNSNNSYKKKTFLTFARGSISAATGTILSSRLIEDESEQGVVTSTMVLLDSQANISLYHNPDLLTNIRDAPAVRSVEGINSDGPDLIVNKIGYSEHFEMEVYYHPAARANVLSLSDVDDLCDVNFSNRTFTVITPSGTRHEFKRFNRLHVCDMKPSTCLLTTVKDNKKMYSKRQVQQADKVKSISKNFGYPSPRNLLNMVKTLNNCPVSPKDVARYYEINGPEIAALRGRTHKHKAIVFEEDKLPRLAPVDQTLHVDIMFVNKRPFLLSVGTPLGFTIVTDLGLRLGARAKAPIRVALLNHVSSYSGHGFRVITVLTDGEGAIASLSNELAGIGIAVNPTGPGQHVPVIERKIQEVKEPARGILSTLPYSLPANLLPWLILFVVNRINFFPHKGGLIDVSPREAFLGVRADYKRDCRCTFGDYAECTDPYSDNSMKPRTQACIALCPTGTQGAVKFFCLTTGRVIVRSQFRILPIPDIIIQTMNNLAAQCKYGITTLIDVTAPTVGEDPDAPLAGVDEDLDLPQEVLADQLVDIDTERVVAADLVTADQDEILVEQRADGTPQPVYDPLENPTEPLENPAGNVVDDTLDNPVDDAVEWSSTLLDVKDDPQADERAVELPVEVPLNLSPTSTNGSTVNDTSPFAKVDGIQDPVLKEDVEETSKLFNDVQPIDQHRYGLRSHERDERTFYYPKTGAPMSRQAYEEAVNRRQKSSVFHMSIKRALADASRHQQAYDAIKAELKSQLGKRVFVPIRREDAVDLKPPIRSHMFVTEKFRPDGSFDRLKARLVAGGDMQPREDMTYEEVASPTVPMPVLFMISAIAAREGRIVKTADVPTAYLNADNSHLGITMVLDKLTAQILSDMDSSYSSYLRKDGSILVKLNKALYGCVESARLWYDHLKSNLVDYGFTENPLVPCVFNKVVDGHQCTLLVYVDDLKCTCVDEKVIDDTFNYLSQQFNSTLKVSTGPIQPYLGMIFDYSKPGVVCVTMPAYVDDLLRLAGVSGTISSPAADHLFHVREKAVLLGQDQKSQFHTLVAKLLYLAKRTRPDILLPISFLTSRTQASDVDDWKKLERVFRYLNGSRELGIVLEASKDPIVEGYIDASYGVHADCRSHTGMLITLGAGPIEVKSTRQKLNTKSSSEAELVACSDMASQVIWTKNFLESQGIKATTKIYQDNMSSINLETRGVNSSDRTKHVSIRYFWLKDRVDSGDLEIVFKPTDEMLADLLTKPIHGKRFVQLRNRLMNWNF